MKPSIEAVRKARQMSHPIFIGEDISFQTPEAAAFYRQIKRACNSVGYEAFLPSEFVGVGENDVPANVARSLVLDKIAQAKLGVFYIGYYSPEHVMSDGGIMIGETKNRNLPIILMYETEKESDLRRTDPKVWWRKKTSEELKQDPPKGIITPTSYTSFLVPESTDPLIIAEIKFNNRIEACQRLELEIERFFRHFR